MTWQEWKETVATFLLVDADRLGTETFREGLYRQSVIDMQRVVETYRIGHETIYDTDDLVIDGMASQGALPAGANLRDAYIIEVGTKCHIRPLKQWPWSNRNDLVCGRVRYEERQGWMVIDPQAINFTVWPKVEEGKAVQIFWDGQKLEFEDDEEVPFGEAAAFAASHFLTAYFELRVNHDKAGFDREMGLFNLNKGKVFLDEKARLRLKNQDPTPQAGNVCRPCGWPTDVPPEPDDDETIEFVAFGDSGEVPLTHTEEVAQLVKGLEPDFVLHLGDTNYPMGSATTIYDYLKKHYWGYIEKEDWIQAWGNHDDETDSGAPLMALFPTIEEINEGKRYYNIVKGHAEFFIVHSGISDVDPDEPDGILYDSVQAQWIWDAMVASSARWKIVVMHRPRYTSDILYTPGSPVMQAWNLLGAGADLVLSGHGHNYERGLEATGLPWQVCGMGGATLRDFGAITNGSQVRYNTFNGVLNISISRNRLQSDLVIVKNRQVIDSLVLTKPE